MPNDGILFQIRQLIDYERLFAEFLTLQGRGTWRTAMCVFHENTDTGSLRVNVDEGFYRCMNPACGVHGDFVDFYMRVRDLRFPDAVRELARRCNIEVPETPGSTSTEQTGVIDEEIIVAAHRRLLATPTQMAWLGEKRGLTEATIRRWQLGHDGQRYFIPIRDELNRVVNVRRYLPGAAAADKIISWRAGFGGARVWPYDTIFAPGGSVHLFEGEMDCLLALQSGLPAMTATGGAGTWRDVWSPLFRGRDVIVCYDADAAGRAGAAQVASRLAGQARSVKIVNLPITEPPGADFTDFIVGHGHTVADYLALVEATPAYEGEGAPAPVVDEGRAPSVAETNGGPPAAPVALRVEPENVPLSEASKADYYNSPIRINVMVSGKTMAPFIVPHQVACSCVMPALPMCQRCPVSIAAGRVQRTLDYDSNEILQYINTPDSEVERRLKKKVGVPAKCSFVQIEHLAAKNVEEIQVIPEIDRAVDDDGEYVTRLAYFIGHGLGANRSYMMTGHTVTEPKRQLATHLIHTAVASQSNIDAFRLTPEVVEKLKVFRPDEGVGTAPLWRKLDEIYEDLEHHTRIYQRRDIMLACDLIFHTITTWNLHGNRVQRGWGEALIIGDSRTGKTTIVRKFIEWYRAGEMCSGENTSIAGLVGGLHQIGTSWALRWGRIPLNDRRLLAIDEAGSLPPEHIERMSGIRSEGIAEIQKIHSEKTNARTRQIWTSNPRSPRPMSSYSQGVLAVKELIGKPEDVARFDIVVTAASGDVNLATVNASHRNGGPTKYTRDICHQRVMWVWSRSPEQVRFTPEAEGRILVRATQQGEKYRYATEIPLVEPNEQRIKLARLAVSAAALFFSTEDGETVLVKQEHVDFAWEFLEKLYAKPSLSFHEYAEIQRREYELGNRAEVQRIIAAAPNAPLEFMQEETFSQQGIGQILDINDRDQLNTVVKKLVRLGFLRRRSARGYFVKTPAAIKYLRELIVSNGGQASFGESLSAVADSDEAPF
jgi:hypothetical protein